MLPLRLFGFFKADFNLLEFSSLFPLGWVFLLPFRFDTSLVLSGPIFSKLSSLFKISPSAFSKVSFNSKSFDLDYLLDPTLFLDLTTSYTFSGSYTLILGDCVLYLFFSLFAWVSASSVYILSVAEFVCCSLRAVIIGGELEFPLLLFVREVKGGAKGGIPNRFL